MSRDDQLGGRGRGGASETAAVVTGWQAGEVAEPGAKLFIGPSEKQNHAKRNLWLFRRRVSEGPAHRVGSGAVCCRGEQSDGRGAAEQAGLQPVPGGLQLIVVTTAAVRRPTTC